MFARRESLKEYVRRYPVVTLVILINLIVFGAMEWYGSSEDGETLFRFGAMFGDPELKPEWWRYVAAVFLHIGFAHLLMNMFALYVFAAPLEYMLGWWRFAALYLVSGVVGNIASYLLHQEPFLGAGASGAIYGVYAAFLYLSIFRKDVLDAGSSTTIRTILIVGVIYSVIVPRVDLYAHVGGFVGGFAFTALLAALIRRRNRRA